MEYVELSGGIWLLASIPFQTTNGALNKLLFYVPFPIFGTLLTVDALSRIGLI